MPNAEQIRKQYQEHIGLTDEDFAEIHLGTADTYRDWLEALAVRLQAQVEEAREVSEKCQDCSHTENHMKTIFSILKGTTP